MGTESLDLRLQIERYLEGLCAAITDGVRAGAVTITFRSEKDLERFVDLGADGGGTLLRILGYTEVDKEREIQIGRQIVRADYLLKNQQRDLAVIELKEPNANIDDVMWSRQLLCYCVALKVPLGLLFNGVSLRVFVNAEDRQLTKYADIGLEPVARVDKPDWKRMADLLACFQAENLYANFISFAKKLARNEMNRRAGRKRQEAIRYILTQTFKDINTHAEADLLCALARVPTLWGSVSDTGDWTLFDPIPNETEIQQAWHTKPLPAPSLKTKRVGFRSLVTAGRVPAGSKLFLQGDRRNGATVRADGQIESAGTVGSIHEVGKSLKGWSGCNGWTEWFVEQSDGSMTPLSEYRNAVDADRVGK